MSQDSKKEEDAEYLRRTANEAQLWWVRAMQRTVEGQKGPQTSGAKFQAALRDSQRREQELRDALEAKEAELLQLQNSSRTQIGQLHRALQESRKTLTDAGSKQDGGPRDVQSSLALSDKGKAGALAAHDQSCLSGLFAFFHSKQAALADASSRALPVPSEKDIADSKASKMALEGAKSEAAKAKDALSAAEAAHSAAHAAHTETKEALEEKIAALQQERDDLAAHLSEESARSESRAEAFKRLQLQTSTERSRDAELMDQQKFQIRQLTVDLNNLHRDLEGKCVEVKRLEELREAAVQELMQGSASQSAQPSQEAEQLDDLARALQQESDALADKAQKAQQQLNMNKSPEAVNRLFDIMDDNRDGVVSPAEFEAHRAEYERVVAENSRLGEDVKMLSALQEEVEALATECRRLQEQEVRLKTDNEHLSFVKGQVQELSSNYDQLIEENDGLRRDQQQLMSLQAATEQSLQEKIAEAYRLQDEKLSLEQEATAMRRQLADAKPVAVEPPPEAEAQPADQAALDTALQEKVEEITMLKAEVERVLKESDALKTGLDNSMAMNDRLEQERVELTGALQSLEDQSLTLAQERDQWLAEVEAARQALDQQNADIQDLVNKNMVQAAEVSALGDVKVKLEEDLDATLQKLQQLQAQAELTNSGGSLPSSSPRPQMREIAEQEAQAQLAWLGAQNTRLKGEVDSLISALDERAIENQRLHADLVAASQGGDAVAVLQADNGRLEKEIAIMAGTLEDFQAANTRLREQLSAMESKEPEVLLDPKLPEEIDALQADRARIQQELEVMTVKYEDHAAENQRLQQELAEVATESQRERERLEAELARVTQEHQHEIHQMHREMALVHSNAEESQDARRSELTQALRESGEELDKLMTQIADQQTELAGLREENRTLAQVRDKAGVLAGEFDAQQADAARLRAENAALLVERQELAVHVEDANAEKNKALLLAAEFRASSLVRPWFNRSGVTYLDSVYVDFASYLNDSLPVLEANQAHTAVMSERIETGDTVKTAQQRYQLALSEAVGGAAAGAAPGAGGEGEVAATAGVREVLEWNTYAITDFVQGVFLQYGLVPPGEDLIFNIYRLFDPEPSKGYLEEEEAVCLADAALRATFASPPKGEDSQQPIPMEPAQPSGPSPELVAQMSLEKEQQAEEMENLLAQFAQLQAQFRRAEARASAAERERDAMERALVREDALTASRGSRASVRTSPERATTHMFALSDGFAPPTAVAAPAVAPAVVVAAAPAPPASAESGLLYMSTGGWQSPPIATVAPQQVAMSSPQVVAGRMAQPVLVAEPQVRSCLTSEVPTTVTRQWVTTAPVPVEAPSAAFVYS